MKEWILVRNGAPYAELAEKLNIDPVAVRVMVNRGLKDYEEMKAFLECDISKCFNYKGLPNLDKAIRTIKEAKENDLKCRIVGDYDADGVCSTTILYKALTLYGLDCDFVIPNRLLDGYGINESIVEKAIEDKVGIIVTCDNGISARSAIDLACDSRIKVVVTDHHTVTESEVPTKTDALVNPKMSINEYPFADICGAFVAFKVMQALFDDAEGIDRADLVTDLKSAGTSGFEGIKYELLELAAIATVTDVMPLVGENRNIVKWVLPRLKDPINPGLKKIVEKAELLDKRSAYTATDIGFRIGPCINAAGRIDVADNCVRLFLSDSEAEREKIGTYLNELNIERKELTDKCVNIGIETVKSDYSDTLPDILVLYLKDCHVAIAGLVAGKIREKFYRPTIVLTDSNDGLTGSGRSIDEYNIIENVQKCADLLTKFGGHKAACGLSMPKENFEELRKRLNDLSKLTEKDLIEKIRIDADMPFGYASEKVINDIAKLEPFGVGNVTPVFAQKDLLLVSAKRVGADKSHVFIDVRDSKNNIRTLKLWRKADEFDEFLRENYSDELVTALYNGDSRKILESEVMLTVTYNPGINEFRNTKSVDFTIKEYKKQEKP